MKISRVLTQLTEDILFCAPTKRGAMLRVLRCGHALIEAKSLLKHGEWIDYVRSIPMDLRKANTYMLIAEYCPRTEATSVHQAVREARRIRGKK